MAKIAIIYCKRIKDHSCIGCAKCYKASAEKNGEFDRHDQIELVAMTDCGDCPGLVAPCANLLKEIARNPDRSIDTLHLGTCVKLAMETAFSAAICIAETIGNSYRPVLVGCSRETTITANWTTTFRPDSGSRIGTTA